MIKMTTKTQALEHSESFYAVVEAQRPEVMQRRYTWVSYRYLEFADTDEEMDDTLAYRENLLKSIHDDVRGNTWSGILDHPDKEAETFDYAEENNSMVVTLFAKDSYKVYLRSDLVPWLLEKETGRTDYRELRVYRIVSNGATDGNGRMLIEGAKNCRVEYKTYNDYFQPWFPVQFDTKYENTFRLTLDEAEALKTELENNNRRNLFIGCNRPCPAFVVLGLRHYDAKTTVYSRQEFYSIEAMHKALELFSSRCDAAAICYVAHFNNKQEADEDFAARQADEAQYQAWKRRSADWRNEARSVCGVNV